MGYSPWTCYAVAQGGGFSIIWSETGYCYVLYVEHGFQKIRKALTKKEKSSKYTSFELNFMGEFLPIFIL